MHECLLCTGISVVVGHLVHHRYTPILRSMFVIADGAAPCSVLLSTPCSIMRQRQFKSCGIHVCMPFHIRSPCNSFSTCSSALPFDHMSLSNACAGLASFPLSQGACSPFNTTQRSLLPFVHKGDCRPCETPQRSLPPLSDHAVFLSTVCTSVAPTAGLGAWCLGPASSTDADLPSFPLSKGACPADTTQTSLLQFPEEGDCRPCETTERRLLPVCFDQRSLPPSRRTDR